MEPLDLERFERCELNMPVQHRSAELVVRAGEDGEDATYEFYFSSEAPVDNRLMYDEKNGRMVYGTEILLHGKNNCDTAWIGSGNAPFLRDHDTNRQCGVITGVELDERLKMLKVTGLKFSRSADGQELKADIDDRIRKNVSVGYVIEEIVELEAPKRDALGVYQVTRWKPYEVSSVSIPADDRVGFRSEETHKAVAYRQKQTNKPNQTGERVMEPIIDNGGNQNPAPIEPVIVREKETDAARIHAIADLNKEIFPAGAELAGRAIAESKSADAFWSEFQPALLAEQERKATVKIGMSDKDKKRFSLVNLIRYMAEDKSIRKSDVELEIEASEAYCSARGISAQRGGMVIPHEAIPNGRAAIISSSTGAGAVEEIHSGEVIEYLRQEAVLAKAGARFINGLVGKFDMARIGVGSSAYWVGEVSESGSDVSVSSMDLDLLTFAMKTVGVWQPITRQMLKQTSLDVEGIVRADIYAALADAIDLAGLAGTGSNNQPTGIMYTSGVGTEEIASANTPSFADVVNMETTVASAKALRGSLAYIAHPAFIGAMKQTLRAAASGFIAENGMANGYSLLSSNNAVKAAVNSMVFGNYSELMVGMWGGIELTVDPYTYARKGVVSINAFQDVDVQLRHPASFCYTTVAS